MKCYCKDVGLLLLRISVAVSFISHGLSKIMHPAAYNGFFAMLHFPQWTVLAVGYVEVIGGVLVGIGLWTSFASAVLVVIIAIALFYAKGGALFRVFNVPVFELELALFAITVALAMMGSGRIAVRKDHGVCKCNSGTCDVGEPKVKVTQTTVEYPSENL